MVTNEIIQEHEIADSTAIKKSTDEQIRELINTLGFSFESKGDEYLVYIIKLGLDDINNIIPLQRKGYPNVARNFQTALGSVAKTIHRAIYMAFCRNQEIGTWNRIFGGARLYRNPTNKEVIIGLVEYLCSIKNDSEQKTTELAKVNSDEYTKRILKTLGVPIKGKGYVYLTQIIKLGLDDINNVIPIKSKGYSNVAKIFETTSASVEIAIWHAIDTASIYGDLETWYSVFGNSYSALKGKPTNTQFIITLVEYLNFLIKESKLTTESTGVDEQSIARTLKLLGISTKIKGYAYLIEIIKLGINDFNNVSPIKEGYFNVAKLFNTTMQEVSSCIRRAVDQSNNSYVDPEIWNQIFQKSHSKVKNAEFIKALVNFLAK